MDKRYISFYDLTQQKHDDLMAILRTLSTLVNMGFIPSPQVVYALTLTGSEDSTFIEP